MKIGITGGTGVLHTPILDNARQICVKTEYGDQNLLEVGGVYFIQRHEGDTPPHQIRHRRHFAAFRQLEVQSIIAIASCGSLKKEIPPGSIVIPDDYIQLTPSATFYDKGLHFTIPEVDAGLRKIICETARDEKLEVVPAGSYWHCVGPRFETRAEIRLMANFADIVGMTLGHEFSLAIEIRIPYAAICSIDNYSHGISEKRLTIAEVERRACENRSRIVQLVRSVINKLQNGVTE